MKRPTTADRVRGRLKDELNARDISQRELADALSKQTDDYWTQSRVGKVLNGNVELKVDDADAIAKVAGIFLTEAVRDRGLEFYAEMTPTELRILERMRQRPNLLQGIMLILDIAPLGSVGGTDIGRPLRPKRGGPLKSDAQKQRA
jgi:transcriptional regulator with XRE-family HTH domain